MVAIPLWLATGYFILSLCFSSKYLALAIEGKSGTLNRVCDLLTYAAHFIALVTLFRAIF